MFWPRSEEPNLTTSQCFLMYLTLQFPSIRELLAHSFAAMKCNNFKESGLLMVGKVQKGRKRTLRQSSFYFSCQNHRSKSGMFSLNTLSSNYLSTYNLSGIYCFLKMRDYTLYPLSQIFQIPQKHDSGHKKFKQLEK